mmetsp:Transcript_653/g.1745  ORF Transcript_653/g.1745 Transcript_653/m.1745 type:complete len:180 (-) Transcript_653:308-847(-)
MSTIAQRLANKAEATVKAAVDNWMHNQHDAFLNVCDRAAAKGYKEARSNVNISELLQSVPGLHPSLLVDGMTNALTADGFSAVTVDHCWADCWGRQARMINMQASWADLKADTEGAAGGHMQGGHSQTCALCQEERPTVVLAPCGHVMCNSCEERRPDRRHCPFCRQAVSSVTNGLFLK